jgi:hypothetical protein
MAISNSSIQIRRSTTTGVPAGGTLKAGEIAYSFTSNTLFLGTSGGNAVVNIGGSYYTSTIDAATNNATGGTLAKRDATGNISFNYITANGITISNLTANSTSYANQLNTPQNFSIVGDVTAPSVSFNGTAGVALSASLNSITTAGSFGSQTVIPTITVAANGRILAVTTNTISTSFSVSDGTNSNTVNGGSTLTFKANTNSGITTSVNSNETVYFGVDSTLARTNTSTGLQTFNSDISIPTGNLTVGGTITAHDINVSGNIIQYNATSTLNVGDPIIYLAANNSGNAVDIGLVGHFIGSGHSGDTSHYQHTGFVRDYNDNKWKLFSNVSIEPTTTVTFDANTSYDTIKVGGIDLSSGSISAANVIAATTLTLTNALTVSYGGTGLTSATLNGITYGNGTAALGVTAAAGGGSDQTWSNQFLTVTNAGVPVWTTTMDGGTF